MSSQNLPTSVRPSPIAGQWYPAQPERLGALLDGYLAEAAPPNVPRDAIGGLFVPHAGYRYSGAVAAHAFRLIQGMDVEIVAVIGPSHHPYSAPAVTSAHDAYQTPLGHVPVDHALLDELSAHLTIQRVQHDPEHALEMELPFLQRVLGPFRLLPLALLDQSWPAVEALGHALAEVLKERRALLVASSDLSHFYPQDVAHQLDRALLDAVAAYDPQRVVTLEDEGAGFACGRGAIAAVMVAAQDRGANTARILDYATSGDILHDYSRVVGYGAAAFYRER